MAEETKEQKDIKSGNSDNETSDDKEDSTAKPSSELAKISLDDLQNLLETSPEGLSQSEAESRIEKYGYNELEEKKHSAILKFLSYFWGPIAWMIEIAAVLSVVARHWEDFIIIAILLFTNALVGFWEEHQASNTVEALKENLAIKAKAKRDGKWKVVPGRELVPGDMIHVKLGDIIPADCRIFDDDEVQVDQSALTGESLPVTRGKGDTLYSGSVLKQGDVSAIVYATGTNTYFGKTASLVESAETQSHFQKAVLKIGDYLIVIALIMVAMIIAVSLFRGDSFLTTLQFALVLTVAGIPVAMPTVLSITMAVGARLLASKQAVVTKLSSIEEIAGIDILCSDKTGTLTKNELKLGDPYLVGDTKKEEIILNGSLASPKDDRDAIDEAVVEGLEDESILNKYTIEHFVPFDPVHKRTEATVKDSDGKEFKVSKGAPQVILKMSANKDKVEKDVNDAINEFASKGYRALGVARSDKEGDWKFMGVLPLFDPPRDDSADIIKKSEDMGVHVKMVTGDQVAIAKEIARKLGMGTDIYPADILENVKSHETGQMTEKIEKADGFAQVFPEHKFHIVEELQKKKHLVGMTGDGVNDAPALKKANVGIAVSGATNAARAASDIVLLTTGLSVIIDALLESRRIFQRMVSYAMYRITETIRVLLFMTLSIIAFNFYPVTAIMIVLLAILNDGAIISIAYDNARPSNKPEVWNMRVVLGIATMLGTFGVAETFGLYYLAENIFKLDQNAIQTLIYLKLSVSGHLTIFVTRTKGPFWSFRPAKILLGAVVGTQTLATLITVFGIFMHPIGIQWAGFVWGYSLFFFLLEDRVKLIGHKIFGTTERSLLMQKRHKKAQKA
jgi:H+-transporting ATPase